MDTSPGGESFNQYEEATSFTSPNTDQKPNFGDRIPPRGDALAAEQKRAKESKEHRDENRRYGEAISEHGFGGTTMGGTHSTTSTSPARETSNTSNIAATAGGVGGGGEEGRTHRHGSYEDVDVEAEEREKRERKWQG
ncbi:hypothetical protein O988_08966, partial [Pseudogymnoascus sp. VKM F-3808]